MTGITHRYRSPIASPEPGGSRVVLRARIGAHLPHLNALTALQDRLAHVITRELTHVNIPIDLLQLGVALDPRWHTTGPTNRVTPPERAIKMSSD